MQDFTKFTLAMRYIGRVLPVLRYGGEMPPLPAGTDFETVYHVAKKHSLASSVWYVVEPAVRAEGNTALIEKWEAARSMGFAQNMIQTREFAALTALFTSERIKFLPMKGFLFKELWARPEHRTMADMDFLFEEADLPRVTALLTARGYRLEIEEGEVHDTFDKPPYLHVEAHRSLFSGDTDGFDKWVAREDNPYWYYMRPEDFLTFNVGHIHKHYVMGGCGARSLFDVYLYLRERGDTLDTAALDTALRARGLADFYHMLLHLVYFWYAGGEYPFTPDPRYIKDGVPTDALLEMEHFIITGGAYGSTKNRVDYNVQRRGKLGYIIRLAFPPYRTMCGLYRAVRKCPILLPFAYPFRWVQYLFNGKVKQFCKLIFGKEKK